MFQIENHGHHKGAGQSYHAAGGFEIGAELLSGAGGEFRHGDEVAANDPKRSDAEFLRK